MAKRKNVPVDVNEEILKNLRETRINFEKMKSHFSKNLTKQSSELTSVVHKLKEHDEILREISSFLASAEDTFLNVLLAIRQNEFLQAWYPPQQGYPELMVIGSHPSKTKTKGEQK